MKYTTGEVIQALTEELRKKVDERNGDGWGVDFNYETDLFDKFPQFGKYECISHTIKKVDRGAIYYNKIYFFENCEEPIGFMAWGTEGGCDFVPSEYENHFYKVRQVTTWAKA